jgi:uncharacterized protein YkwD
MFATAWIRLLATTLFVTAIASPALAQTQYSIGSPTNEQQYMLELINRARANGGAEATRLQGFTSNGSPVFNGGLQEGPPNINGEAWTISNTNQPLSWNPLLFNCAQGHANNLNNGDQFFSGQNAHTFGGTTPSGRIAAAGYPDGFQTEYNGPTTQSGFVPGPENIATNVSIGSGPFTGAKLIATILNQHNGLFTDTTVSGRGHRMTTMLGFWREIGIGTSAGTDFGQNQTWESLYTVQNFGTRTNPTPFITGVIYQDTNGNGFYDPGEGIGGVRIDVAGSSFFAISSSSGGYSVPVPGNGSFNVTFSGGGQATTQRTVSVAGSLNAKSDLVAGAGVGPTQLVNISTRLPVGAGDDALIAGFIVVGTQPKKVIIRGIGPSLGRGDQLGNPTLELFTGQTSLGTNDDWMNSTPADKQAIIDSTVAPSNTLEPAIVRTLPASTNGTAYTAVLRGVNNSVGIGVIEVYDLDRSVDSKLANISTRGLVQTGDKALFAGMIVLGPSTQKVIIRAIGPSLTVAGKMLDPMLELRDANGTVLRANDNWRIGGQEQEIIDSTVAPTNNAEAALIHILPGSTGGASYTAIVGGVGGEQGIAVVEVYALQ